MDIFKILEVLAASTRPMGPGEIRNMTDIPPATLNRQLHRCQACGYVRRIGHGSYEVGPGLLRLSQLAMENARALPFRSFLSEVSRRTNLNAELFSLTTEGPKFLMGESGRCERRTTLQPGQVLRDSYNHPAWLFFFQRYPEAMAWRRRHMGIASVDVEELRARVARAVKDNFVIERGRIRPELAMAGVPTGDYLFCLCVGGFISDFPKENETELRDHLQKMLKEFEGAQKEARELLSSPELAGMIS